MLAKSGKKLRVYPTSTDYGLQTIAYRTMLTKYNFKVINMACEVEFINEFEAWWNSLSEREQDNVAAGVMLPEEYGSTLPFPYSSRVESSKHSHMRELGIQHAGKPYRVLYAFDPRRIAILLTGGDKTGKDRWYEKMVPIADCLYHQHLESLKDEGNI